MAPNNVIVQNRLVLRRIQNMFNNKKCFDTVFLVNESQFHASSHLITVSNAKLDEIVRTHFENCGDREIRIGPIKHDESFCILLKYMYGVPINFTEINTAIMCEVLNLCERFHFYSLLSKLKSYLSKFDSLNVDNLVELLNASKKHAIEDLFERCKIFAYRNADDVVLHASCVNLQYDILCEVLEADWFYTKEIDILRITLDWHSENVSKECKVLNDSAQENKEHNAESNKVYACEDNAEPLKEQSEDQTSDKSTLPENRQYEIQMDQSVSHCSLQNEAKSNSERSKTNNVSNTEVSNTVETSLSIELSQLETTINGIGKNGRNEIEDNTIVIVANKNDDQMKITEMAFPNNGREESIEPAGEEIDEIVSKEKATAKENFTESTVNLAASSLKPSNLISCQKFILSPPKLKIMDDNGEWRSLLHKANNACSLLSIVAASADNTTETNDNRKQSKTDGRTDELEHSPNKHEMDAAKETAASGTGKKDEQKERECTKCFKMINDDKQCISCGEVKNVDITVSTGHQKADRSLVTSTLTTHKSNPFSVSSASGFKKTKPRHKQHPTYQTRTNLKLLHSKVASPNSTNTASILNKNPISNSTTPKSSFELPVSNAQTPDSSFGSLKSNMIVTPCVFSFSTADGNSSFISNQSTHCLHKKYKCDLNSVGVQSPFSASQDSVLEKKSPLSVDTMSKRSELSVAEPSAILSSATDINDASESNNQTDDEEANISSDLVLRFSFNVLKRLLSHIRILRINALEMMRLMKSDQYVKYRDHLEDENNFSLIPRDRVMCVRRDGVLTAFRAGLIPCNITKLFTVKGAVIANNDIIYESVEEFEIEHVMWKIGLKSFSKTSWMLDSQAETSISAEDKKCSYEMYLKCAGLGRRRCTVECSFQMISTTVDHPDLVLPAELNSKSTSFTNDSTVMFDTFYWGVPGLYSSACGARTFKVVFKSFNFSLKERN